MDGIDILKTVKRDNPDIPIIIISGHGNIEIAVAAIKQGAYDFIEKPFNIDQLMVVVSRAMKPAACAANQELRRKDVTTSDMIGSSTAFKALKSQLEKVTKSNGRVMLTGLPGTGKELAARFIHVNSNRAGAPFVSVSSATMEPDRMEEVLFGRETAERGVEPGLLEQAHGGVVYFDEVGDMPLGAVENPARPDRTAVHPRRRRRQVRVDLRVISSTTRDLPAKSAPAATARDYDRLNVVPITVPPCPNGARTSPN
ncbi:MAG: sigma 54-interacting transcriptional regulator [Paracoccaceae bacterium]